MTSLLEQQSLLLRGLFDAWDAVQANTDLASSQCLPTSQYQRGLQAYRSNGTILVARVLSDVYPTVKRLMGADQFEGLAKHLWRVNPPSKGDLAQWGDALEDFLRGQAELMQHEPWLADIAALEWAMHQAQTMADSQSDEPVPIAVVESDYAIADAVNDTDITEITQAAQRVLVYRQCFEVLCVVLPPDLLPDLHSDLQPSP